MSLSSPYSNTTELQLIREARYTIHEWIYNTLPYKLCAWLPLPRLVKRFFANRVDDIIDYLMELTCAWAVIFCLVTGKGYQGAKTRTDKPTIIGDLKRVINTPGFEESMTTILPRLYGWYVFWRAQWILVKRVVDAAKWLIRFNRSKAFRVLFGRSPADASRFYQCYRKQPDAAFTEKIYDGHVRLHFFTSLKRGQSLEREIPDISIDLMVTKYGVDTSVLRERWGIESLAVITNIDPFRMFFNPANEDNLSALAAYDLSNQFTTPIKVYEPHVSETTAKLRKLHDRYYLTVLGLLTQTTLILGFGEAWNTTYISFLWGQEYADRYVKLARRTRRINLYFQTGYFLFLDLIKTLILLPIAIVYQTSYLAVKSARYVFTKALPAACSAVARLLILIVRTIVRTIADVFTFFLSLETRELVIAFLAGWWALAEYYSFRASQSTETPQH